MVKVVRKKSFFKRVSKSFNSIIILVIVAALLLLALLNLKGILSIFSHADVTSTSGCGLSNPAFCDTFDQPMGNGNRAGQLNGVVWGASRTSSAFGFGGYNAWWPSTSTLCNTTALMAPSDIQICNGLLVETVNDGGIVPNAAGQTVIGMYPKQPFDFAGRVGKVTFDVGDDTQGGHAAWPVFDITSLPFPAPNGPLAGNTSIAQNMFGFDLAFCEGGGQGSGCENSAPSNIPSGDTCSSVGAAWTTTNYVLELANVNDVNCVIQPTQQQIAAGQLNHFEVDFLPSGNEVDVYGSDPGQPTTNLRLIAKITNFTMPLTRGFIWAEDAHYFACKFNSQCTHTFAWDNVGFDGPVLPRDLDYEVPDALTAQTWFSPDSEGTPVSLGYHVDSGSTKPLTFGQAVRASDLSAASAAVVTLNVAPDCCKTPNIVYSMNGGQAQTYNWPSGTSQGDQSDGPNTANVGFALPVPLSQVHAGTNTVTFSTDPSSPYPNGYTVENVDLKLVGAAGFPTCFNPSNCAGSQYNGTVSNPSPTPSPISSATPTPMITPTQSPQLTPTPMLSSGACANAVLTSDVPPNPPFNAYPQGTTFNFTASASCPGTAKYQWWIGTGDTPTWKIAVPYSSQSTFHWDTSTLPPNAYWIDFWVENASGNISTFDTEAKMKIDIEPNGSPTPVLTTAPTSTPLCSSLVGDLNSDGKVDLLDLSALLSNWGQVNATMNCNLHTSGSIGLQHLSILLSQWGQ